MDQAGLVCTIMFVDFNTIETSEDVPAQHGHRIYDTRYRSPRTEKSEHIFYKENKHNKPINSNLEVAFGDVAKLFLIPGLTSNQCVVQKANEVSGVASEDIVYSIYQNLQQGEAIFYSLDGVNERQFKARNVNKAEDIPVYFFNQFQSNFFLKLHQLKKDRFVFFDMESLASVLTTAYTLEEDDLHKGNFGFYLKDNNGKIDVVFIKIDHDLMLCDSIMSRGSARVANWLYADRAFAVSPRDLRHFPALKDSGNHYWPTNTALLVRHGSQQVYVRNERKILAALSKDAAFQQAKWRSFFKHILLGAAQIKQSVAEGFDVATPEGQAYTALVTNAVVARQARLRAVLFSLPEFRDFVVTIKPEIEEKLIHEIASGSDVLIAIIQQSITDYKCLCQTAFEPGDTPLHAAIRLGNYRYDESWHDYGRYVNTLNTQGQTPLDVAIAQLTHQQNQSRVDLDGSQSPALIIHDLIQRGARKTPAFRAIQTQVENKAIVPWGERYREKARIAHTNELVINVFRELGADCRLTLKMKKELSVQCLEEHIKSSRVRGVYNFKNRLKELKLALNGDGKQKPDPALQFIRQLRSRLWIVRQIRGLFGGSSTQVEFNKRLDNELSFLSPSNCGATFFNTKASFSNEKYALHNVARLDGEFDAKPCDTTCGFYLVD